MLFPGPAHVRQWADEGRDVDQDRLPGPIFLFQLGDDPRGIGVARLYDLHQVVVGLAGQLDEIHQIPSARPGQAQIVHHPGENLPRAGGPNRFIGRRNAAFGEQPRLRETGHVAGDVPAPAAPVPRRHQHETLVGVGQHRGEIALDVQNQATVRTGHDLLQDRQQKVGLARSRGADHQHAGMGQGRGQRELGMNGQPAGAGNRIAGGPQGSRRQGDTVVQVGFVLQAANMRFNLLFERKPRQQPRHRQRQRHERAAHPPQ